MYSIMEIRWSYHRFISTAGFTVLVTQTLYIELAPDGIIVTKKIEIPNFLIFYQRQGYAEAVFWGHSADRNQECPQLFWL